MIDIVRLLHCGIGVTQAKQFAGPLAAACARFKIDDSMNQAGLIAQCMHESANFTKLEEGLYYSKPETVMRTWPTRFPTLASAMAVTKNPKALAAKVYDGRMGNVNPGDGWKNRGRGLIQTTGAENYAKGGEAIGVDLVAHPELACEPENAALLAAFFWTSHRGPSSVGRMTCFEAMNNGEFDKTTLIVNGGRNGAAERRANFAACQEAFR